MDFFQRQDIARKKTKWLVVYFVVAVMAMVVAIYLAALVIFSGVQLHHQSRNYNYNDAPPPTLNLWNPQLFLGVALGTIAIVLIGSSYKTMALAAGGSAVSEMMGGRLVNSNTT